MKAMMLMLLMTTMAHAGEWPRFMGPDGTGVVETGEKINRTWPANGPRELWKVPVSYGFGGPAIVAGKVYILDRQKGDRDVLRVLDLKTGQTIWEQGYDAGRFRGGYAGSRSTPTVDGNRVYTVGVNGQIYCFDVSAKKVVWNKSLRSDFGAEAGDWGFAQSPLLVDDKLIVSAAGGDNGLIALNKDTGTIIWKTKDFGGTDCYTSPALITLADEPQIVMWHRGAIAGFDPKSGTQLWDYKWRTNRPIPQPVHLGNGKFFLTVGYGGGCSMIQVSKTGGGWSVSEIFQDERAGSKVPPALFYRGHIYTSSEQGRGLQCFDADGNLKWETGGKPRFGLGSLLIADGVIFIINGDNGELVMVEANPAAYKELGRAKVLAGRDVWAPLALSNGMLVVRDHTQMKCLVVGTAATTRSAGSAGSVGRGGK